MDTPISNSPRDSSVIDMDNIEMLQLPSEVGQLTHQPPPRNYPSTAIVTQYLNDGDTFERKENSVSCLFFGFWFLVCVCFFIGAIHILRYVDKKLIVENV